MKSLAFNAGLFYLLNSIYEYTSNQHKQRTRFIQPGLRINCIDILVSPFYQRCTPGKSAAKCSQH